MSEKGKFQFKVPNTLILLFGMMVLAQIITYVIPKGTFNTIEEHGHEVVAPGTYHEVEDSESLPIWHLFLALPRAFADSQGIIFFIFIIGGALSVIKSTGAIDAILGKTLEKFGHKPRLLITIGMFVFAAGSSTLGMAEEYLPFVPVLLALGAALKLDAIASVGIMVVGYGVGYGVAAINPFTVMIAQEVAGLKPTSGFEYRLALFLPLFLVGWWHLTRYSKRIQQDDTKSFMHGVESINKNYKTDYPRLNRLHSFVLILTLFAVLLIVYGISNLSGWGWYLNELGAVFLALAVIVVIVARINSNKAAIAFVNGAAELTNTALLIGFARSIALILEDGQVLHTIVHSLAVPLQTVGPEIASVGMYFIQSVLNFFIPSGSGQAFVTMPLMAPISDLVGVSRQIAVLAYQFGDGFTNMLVPTNAVLMGILGIAGIPYDRWFRFIIPLMFKLWLIGSLALVVAVLIGYQ
ncbi:MAG TPA: short-chain fatty acid transporter [Cytophagales bacterium]|jgi:uncharacterized ion transporter superfamily protein YfcC|nr:short-chain fatty acid transporter [Cytophagales bacterium]